MKRRERLGNVLCVFHHGGMKATIEANNANRAALVEGLTKLGVNCLESHTNFVLAEVGNGSALAKRLEHDGLIVRPVASYSLPRWVRISVGTRDEIVKLLKVFEAALKNSRAPEPRGPLDLPPASR